MIEQTTLRNILTWIIAVILFIFQSLNYFISRIKKFVKHGQKNTTVVTTDTIISSESNPNNNNAPENVITVQGLIQNHFDIPLIIAEDEPNVNDFIKNAQLLNSYDNYKEKKKIDQFMEHLVDDSYVARGLGLITANVGREAEFYLYSKYDNNFENIVIKLKGRQGEIGQITIPNQNPTNSIETKSIPMDYFYDEDRIKVTYTPFAEGVYTLTLVRNGLSICRSPYYISVEKSPTNSRSQIRLGTKKYKMVTKFAKAKHVPLETCDNSIPVIEPSKSSISRNILPTTEENSIRTDVMSIVTKFESNSIHLKKNDQKLTVNRSKKSTKTDLLDEISISADSNTQPKIETGNDYDTNISDLSSLCIYSNSKSNDKKCSSNLDVSNRNSKSNYVNSIEIESNLVKRSNKKLDKSIRNINDMPRVKNMSSNHLEPTNSVLLKENLNDKSLDEVEKHNQTYKTNEPIHGQNQSEAFLDPITVDKFEIKCIDNEAYTHNKISCFDDDHRKTVIVMKNINELETHPNISMNQQFTDSTQYNINTPFTSVLTKITNDVCEKCSIKVLRILSEFPRDINITHNNNSNENCSSHETVLAQPISINTNIDNLFEKPISPTNEHKTDNLLTNSPTNMKLMDTIDKDIKYNYINEIKPINTTFNEIYCDINNTTKELMVKQNKHDGEINKSINDKITNNFTIPITKNNIDKHKIDHLENILSTDNKMQIQVQNVQKFSEHNMDKDKTNQFQFHDYINNELNDINKENEKILDTRDIVTINNDKKCNEELVINELKAKNVIIPDEYKNIQSSFINSQTVLASMEDKLLTLRYKPEDIRQEINNISNTNVILHENQKLIIENSIEPVLKNFKNKMVEKITQLYLNKDLTRSDNTSIIENHNINLTNNLQKNQLHNNADNKKNKTKLIEIIRSQLTNHFHKNDIPGMILNNKNTDNNQVYKYLENIIKTNMNPNETHSQRLDENNIQTLVSIAKNQLNKQQLDDEFKMMRLENVTSNIEIKKTNDNEKVQDTEIKLKNIPNDTSIKIETTTKSIKSNTSEKTDLESNIDNKKNIKSIKLKNKVNDLTKIQNMFKINEIGENNKRNTKIKSKPTENASREQIKKQEDKVVKIKIFNDAKDLTTEKENIYKFPHSVIVTVNKENETSTIIDTSRVSEIELEKINNSAQSDTSKLNNPFIKPQIQKIVVEIVTNNNKMVIDSVAIIIHEETEDKKKVAKRNNPKTKYWIQINDHELYTINAYHDTIKPIDKDRVIETEMPKISIQTNITIDNNLEESNKKKIEENIKNDLIIETPTISLQTSEKLENINETKITPYTVSSTEQIEETIAVESESCLLIDTSNVPVEQKNIIGKSIEHPISIENRNKSVKESKVIKTTTETELIKNNDPLALNKEEGTGKENNLETEIETEKPIHNINKEDEAISLIKITTVSDDENIKIKKTGEHQLTIETQINYDENLKVVNINTESAPIPNNDSSTENIGEPINKENIPETEVETKMSEDNTNKEGETCTPTNTQNISTDEKITIEETTEEPFPIETLIKYAEKPKILDSKTETEPSPNTGYSIINVQEPIDREKNPETEINKIKSIDIIIKKFDASSKMNTSIESVEDKNIKGETTENPLPKDQPIKSVKKSKVVNINTESESIENYYSSAVNEEEPFEKENIPETEVETEVSTDNMKIESEPCSTYDTPTVSDKEKIIKEETTDKQLPNNQPIKFVEDSKQVVITTETEPSINSNSLTISMQEQVDKERIPETRVETKKLEDNINKEGEPCPLTNAQNISTEEKITTVETIEEQLLIETPIKCVVESKVVNINTEYKSTPNNDSSAVNVEETIEKENIPETEVETKKSEDNPKKESEPCPLTNTPNISIEEKATIEEIIEEPLQIEISIQSVQEIKVLDIKTETEPSPNTDSSTLNLLEPIDKENIPETEVETKKSEDNPKKESEPCPPINTQNISDDERKIIDETNVNPLLIETPIQCVEESKAVNINTKSESIPNNNSSAVAVEEPIEKENIPETEVETKKSEDNINKEGELCPPTNTQNISTEEKITIEETIVEPLLIETPIKCVEESKVVNINTESESIPNNDSSAVNEEKPIEKENISETEVETKKSEDIINKEGELCPPTNTQNISTEEKITIDETIEEPLPIEIPIKCVEESKVVNINTESESIPNNDSSAVNEEKPIEKENIPETVVETKKSEDNPKKESEPCPLTNTPNISIEEKATIEEIIEEPLQIEISIQSVQEIKVLDIKTETEPSPNTDSSTLNLLEPIEKENIPETVVETKKSEDNINKEGELCPPTNTQNISTEEKVTIEETTEEPLTIETPIQSVENSKEVDITAETDPSINSNTSTKSIQEQVDTESIPENRVETKKSEDIINKEGELCPPTNTQNISTEEKITIDETIEEPLPIEIPIKCVEESKVVNINTESESIPNKNSSAVTVEEPIEKENIPEIEVETNRSEDNIDKEGEPCPPTNTQNISDDERKIIDETNVNPLLIETPIKCVEESKVININTESESKTNNDSSAVNEEKPIEKENIPETVVETKKSEDNIDKEGELCPPTNTQNISDDERKIIDETNVNPLLIETPIKCVEESKVININTESESKTNNDSSAVNEEKPIEKENIPETVVETKKSEDNIDKEGELCPPTNTQNISDDERKIIDETNVNPLLIETPIKCVEESKVINIYTESESKTNNDSSAVNEEKPIEKENIPDTEVETKKSEDNIDKEGEPCPPTNTQNISDDERKIIDETNINPLLIETPIKCVEESKVININTESESKTNNDSSAVNEEKPIEKENIPETVVETKKSKDNIDKEGELCPPTNTQNISDDERKIIDETNVNPLLIETPIKCVEESKVININTESESKTNNDSSAVNEEKPIEKENIPETVVETKKSEDNIDKEGELCPPTNTQNISDDERKIIDETNVNPLLIETPIKCVEESKVININTESESKTNNDSSAVNEEKPIEKENIPETVVETKKSEDNIDKEGDLCPPTNTQNISDDERKIIDETNVNPLLIETPIKCVEESKVININTESESKTNNDSSAVNEEKPIEKENIPETVVETKKSEDNIDKEDEPCPLTNAQNISTEEKITIEETIEEPLPIEIPIKCVEESKVVNINTESESIPNKNSSAVTVEEPIEKENIPEIEVETKRSEDNIDKEGEPCPPTNTQNISEDERKIIDETNVNPLLIETPIKCVEESKVININTESESIPNNDSSAVNEEKPIEKENIPETVVETKKSEDNIDKEGELCPPFNTQNISTEEKITIEERIEEPLPIEIPIKCVEESKAVNINTESESIPNNDSSAVNEEKPIDKENIPETEVETKKSEDNPKKESEPCPPTNTQNISDDQRKIIDETNVNPLLIETPNKCVEESNVVNINTESESIPNNNSSAVTVEEPIEKENIPETEVKTEKSTDNTNIEIEPCSPANTPNISNENKITILETTDKLLTNDQSTKYVEELKLVNINIETEPPPNTDFLTLNVETLIYIENNPETEIEAEKSIGNIIKEGEASSMIDTSIESVVDKNIIEETIENSLPNEQSTKSVKELKVVDINTESELMPNNDSSMTNVEEPFNKDNVPETQIETVKSIDENEKECEACSPTDTSSVSIEEKNIIDKTIANPLLNEPPIKSVDKFKVLDINTETEPSPNTGSLTVNVEVLIDKENIREIQIETDKLIDYSNKECESRSPTDKLAASSEKNNLTEETMEILLPIETFIKSSTKAVEELKENKINTETVFVPNIDSSTLNAEEPSEEDYFSKIVIKTDKTLDFVVKECETCPPIDTSMYVTEEIKGIDGTIEKLIPIGSSFVIADTENLTSIDGINTIMNRQLGKEYLKDIESSTSIDTVAFVKDQKVEENETLIENILTINTSTASVQGQIQVEEVIKDESVVLINDSVTFDEISPEEQNNIETAKISSITVMEEQTDINRDEVMYTCEEPLDKTIVEKSIHSETTSTTDILVAVDEQRALETEVSENATQILNDTFTETVENLIKMKKKFEKETTTPIVVAKSGIEWNEKKLISENKTSTPVHLASTNKEQTEIDMVTEIASPNVNILNSNTKIILVDKEIITENSNNPKHCYLKFGETSKIHSLENEDNLPGKSYGIQKLEMSVQRMKTSNEDYYEKTFLQLEQTEKISVENKDKVDCENKNIIDDKLYTVNESDLNAILCASSLEEALTLLDSKIKFKFKHRKLSNKANSTPHIPKIQSSESRSSGTNTNFTDAREFFKEIEKKCKK
ncbi:titin-like isoform X11 [Aphis gossypii]|uniref:titin-like isoform X11 n=1 Tax=Aphis gossypii TaxID=80765 RepID=UPI0021596E9A|nr:titin-like isoform X11 [Aphis gossypii]